MNKIKRGIKFGHMDSNSFKGNTNLNDVVYHTMISNVLDIVYRSVEN